MASELGEVVSPPPSLYLTDSSGNPIDADSTPTWSVVLPDGTAGVSPGVLHGGTGDYYVNYLTTQVDMHLHTWTALVGGNVVKFGPDMFMVRNPALAPAIGLVEARRHLRIFSIDPARDEEIRDFTDAATVLCENHTGRTYRRQTVTETFDGGRPTLALSYSPVASVTTVTESGTARTSADWVLNARSGLLTRGTTAGASCWQSGLQNVVVAYVVGGPGAVSAAARQAVKVTLSHLWSTQRGGTDLPRTVGSDGEYSTNSPPWSLPRQAEQLLDGDIGAGFA